MAGRPRKEEKVEGIAQFDVIDGFVLENPDKLQRVIEGEVRRAGVPEGGLLAKYGELENIPKEEVIAHYDKLAGYITKSVGGANRVKVKRGAFWDFKKKRPRGEPKEGGFDYKPEIRYLFKVGGEAIEVDDPSKLAQAVTTLESARSEKERANEARKERAKRKRLTK